MPLLRRNETVRPRPVVIELRDGRRLRGVLHLRPSETAQGLLAKASPFLTIKTSRGDIAFHRDHIAAIVLAEADPTAGHATMSQTQLPLGTRKPCQHKAPPNQSTAPPRPKDGFDPCRLLGVTPGASREELKAAWRRRIAECHPDRVAAQGAGADIVAAAQRQAAQVNAAYQTLAAMRRS